MVAKRFGGYVEAIGMFLRMAFICLGVPLCIHIMFGWMILQSSADVNFL